MARPEKVRIGDILVKQGQLTQEQLDQALALQKKSGVKLGRVLVEHNFISEDRLYRTLAHQLIIPYVDLKQYHLNEETVNKLPEAQARRFRALVLEDRQTHLLVGMSDPSDLFAYDELSRILKHDLELAVLSEHQLLEAIDRVYRRTDEISGLARELGTELGDTHIDFGLSGDDQGLEDATVVKLLQSLFDDASQVNASDIHIEPQEKNLQIRFRIDGHLHLQSETDSKIASAIVLRLKLMAGLNISEKRLPQDGRFNVKVKSLAVDVRMSSMPTQYGESIVMRLLRQSAGGAQGLDNAGMPEDMLIKFRRIIHRSNGMVLVTGPTGSGKTTTLYAGLSELNTLDKKIITVEDPVEYRLPGLNQVQVNEKINLDFARVLRATLRQDPDIILVGEIRDQETAEIGLRAAITGHMVFSTLHTRSAANTPIRLIDMGVPSFMAASALQAVLAQRLVRLICDSCKEPYQLDAYENEWLVNVMGEQYAHKQFSHGRGCTHCNMTGYRGRTGVHELLEMTPKMVEAIGHNKTAEFTSLAAQQMGENTLHHNAFSLAIAGKTTIPEVISVATQEGD